MHLPSIRNWPRRALILSSLWCAMLGPLYAATESDDFNYDQVARDKAKMVEEILAIHNDERVRLGHAPLRWDEKLAYDAANYARMLAEEGRFEHANQSGNADPQGENLWMGSKGAYDWDDMVAMWLDEKQFAKSGAFPNVTKTDNWSDVGHYTQMIWPETKRLGCGLVGNEQEEYLVCRYLPAGNVLGQVIKVNPSN